MKMPALRIASWNVRTMCPDLSDYLTRIENARKTAIIDRELSRLNVDIASLKETRLAANGSLPEKVYTFFWQKKLLDEPRLHGVGFAVKNSLLSTIEPPTNGTERMLSLRMSTASGSVNLLSISAPTLCSPPEVKDLFYEKVHSIINSVPHSEHLFFLGDFNARVGDNHDSWPTCLGHYGTDKMKENGQRLLELCS